MSLRRVLSIAAVLVAVMPGQAAAQKGQWKTLARTSDGHQTVAYDTATMEGTPDPRVFLVTRRSVIEHNARDSSYGMIEGEKYDATVTRMRVNCGTQQVRAESVDYYRGSRRLTLKSGGPRPATEYVAPGKGDGTADAVVKFCSSRNPTGG